MSDSAARPVWVFGAGPTGRALVQALAPLPFAVTWIDARRASFPAELSPTVKLRISADPARLVADAPVGAFILIMTYSNTLDLSLAAVALQTGRFPFVGMAGSATKRMRFIKRMIEAGMERKTAGGLVCPVGVTSARNNNPDAVAAGIVAELLIRDVATEADFALATAPEGDP